MKTFFIIVLTSASSRLLFLPNPAAHSLLPLTIATPQDTDYHHPPKPTRSFYTRTRNAAMHTRKFEHLKRKWGHLYGGTQAQYIVDLICLCIYSFILCRVNNSRTSWVETQMKWCIKRHKMYISNTTLFRFQMSHINFRN